MAEFRERKRWVFFGLPFTFTVYTIKEDMITTDKGLFKIEEDDCYMYKVVDVRLEASLFERMFKLGTVVCFTSDTTDKQLQLKHIRNAKAIKNFILETSEKERLKRRTINTLNLNSVDVDGDGIADNI